MAVVKKEKSSVGRKERTDRRKRLGELFPGGVAEVRPFVYKRANMTQDPPDYWNTHRPSITTIPLHVVRRTGATHAVSGNEIVEPAVIELHVWPVWGRTDRFPMGKPYFREPLDVLEALVDHPGYGKEFKLYKVDPEQIRIEEDASRDPESQAIWKSLRGTFQTNEQLAGVAEEKAPRPQVPVAAEDYVEEDYVEEDDDNASAEVRLEMLD